MWDPLSEFSHAIFPNGLELHSAYWPNRPWQMVFLVVHSGSDADPFGAEGTAHFVEHLISESSGFNRKEIEKKFDYFGGSVNLGRTSYAATIYSFFGPTNQKFMIDSFNLFGRMIFENALDADLESNRQIVLAEFDRYFSMEHKYHLALLERQSLYPEYFRSRSVSPLGLRESVKEINKEKLKDFYDRNYVPKNISIVSTGGLKIYELMDLLFRSNLAQEKSGNRNLLPVALEEFKKPKENFHLFSLSKYYESAEESLTNSGGYRSVARFPGKTKRWSVYFLKEMIGKLLHQEVREKKSWTYSMSARNYYLSDVQELVVECPALSLNAIDEIETTVIRCFNQIQNNTDLFEQMKKKVLQKLKLIDISGVDLCEQAADHMAATGKIPTYHEWEREISSVNLKELSELACWVVPEMRWTLVIKP